MAATRRPAHRPGSSRRGSSHGVRRHRPVPGRNHRRHRRRRDSTPPGHGVAPPGLRDDRRWDPAFAAGRNRCRRAPPLYGAALWERSRCRLPARIHTHPGAWCTLLPNQGTLPSRRMLFSLAHGRECASWGYFWNGAYVYGRHAWSCWPDVQPRASAPACTTQTVSSPPHVRVTTIPRTCPSSLARSRTGTLAGHGREADAEAKHQHRTRDPRPARPVTLHFARPTPTSAPSA